MTPSIILRFARYHGIGLADVHEDDVLVTVMHGIRSNSETQAEAHDRLIQSLTRIEDAEMLAWSMAQDKPRVVQNALDLERCALLLRAGVNPEKWDGLKDEET